jgi:predicted GIY-YIG superfamily endonuclease
MSPMREGCRFKNFTFSSQIHIITNQSSRKIAKKNRKLRLMWYVYIIKDKQKFYTGITTALKNRLHQHGNPPLLYKEAFPDKHQAAKRKRQIKGFSKAKKQELITGYLK